MGFWDDFQASMSGIGTAVSNFPEDVSGATTGLRNAVTSANPVASFINQAQYDMSPETQQVYDELGAFGDVSVQDARNVVQNRKNMSTTPIAGTNVSSGGGASGGFSNDSGNTLAGNISTSGTSAVDALSAARAPRTTTFGNVFGSTGWDPETGQFIQETSPEAASMTSGLWGQMQGVQQQLSDFDVGSAADTYLQAVMAPLAGQRAQQDQTTLSRMIASGKLGASGSARAMAEQETQRGLEDLQASAFARQQALGEQSSLMSQQQALQGLLTGVAGQQFAGQQAALEAVPLGQEIMSFPEEPQFQESMFQQQLAAQQDANRASTSASMWSALLGGIFG